MHADEGKVFRRKTDGFVIGSAISLGYDYYEDGVGLAYPYAPKPEDYDEITIPENYSEKPVIDQVLRLNRFSELIKKNTEEINSLNLTNNQALEVKNWYPKWQDYIGKELVKDFIVLYDDNLWKARQTHTVLEIYPPSIETAALYEIIVKDHEGTINDPIPYNPPMEIFEGKYYIQNDVIYKCIRDSQISLSHNLIDLKGLYVE